MGRRPFEKFQGLGNDFLVVDAERWPEAMMTPALARALCDRHLGVGGDGVLWVQRLHGFDGASPQGDRRAVERERLEETAGGAVGHRRGSGRPLRNRSSSRW